MAKVKEMLRRSSSKRRKSPVCRATTITPCPARPLLITRRGAQWDEAELGFHPWQYSEDALEFLRDLPLSRSFDWEGKRILLAHASPWDQTTYVFANGRREHFRRIAQEADADVVILGHTHQPMAVEVNGMLILNPGSVDANRFEPYNATCALLSFPVTRYQIFDINTGRPVRYRFVRLDDLGTNLHHSQSS
jgi:predicted phosphodiesterase